MTLAGLHGALARAGAFRGLAGLRQGAARQQQMVARRTLTPPTTTTTRTTRSMATNVAKSNSGFSLYNMVFASNARYILFVVTGAAVCEVIYGFVGDSIWEMSNRGKLYHQIDWSKWESIYKEDEEDEEDEDEDDE